MRVMVQLSARALVILACCASLACSRKNGASVEQQLKTNDAPIACRLNSLSGDERKREGVLLEEHLSSFEERRERADGFSYRYSSSPELFSRMAELVSLEHRCCPFLAFQLEWRGADDRPWLHITGGERVKTFVSGTFGQAPEPKANPSSASPP